MSDVIFIIKCLVLTFIAAVLLQMKVGESTVETHLFRLAGRSEIQDQLQLAAKGGALAFQKSKDTIIGLTKDALAYVKPVFSDDSKTNNQ